MTLVVGATQGVVEGWDRLSVFLDYGEYLFMWKRSFCLGAQCLHVQRSVSF
jgi:hypothetical protein